MATRTQLNINIKPELLKRVKQNAIKSGMTLGEYVCKLIESYSDNDEIILSSPNIENRIKGIENELGLISSKLKDISSNHSNTKTLKLEISEVDIENYSKLIEEQFKKIARNEMLTAKETWDLFSKQTNAKKIKQEHLIIIQDVLRGEKALTQIEFTSLIEHYHECPVSPCFKTMSKKPLDPKLINITEKIKEARTFS